MSYKKSKHSGDEFRKGNDLGKRCSSAEFEFCVGRKPINELLIHKPHRLKKVVLLSNSDYTAKIKDSLTAKGVAYDILSQDEFNDFLEDQELSSLNHQGVCGEITPATSISFAQLLERAIHSESKVILALDQVQDPQNLGAIFRIAECAGLAGIVYPERRSASVNSITRRISAGATEFVPFSEVKNLATALNRAKKDGFWIYGTSLEENSRNLYKTEILRPSVLVFGAEGAGLRRQTSEICDTLVQIPQYGCLQSMNVSASVAVMAFELRRRSLE